MTGRVLDGHTVLVVEDEFLVAALLADVLEDAGARVLGPASGLPAALSLVDAGGFDCAVLDWNLDGTCSDPIARALEQNGKPFVIATGYHQVPQEFAAHPLIGKPFDLARLVSIVAELVASST
jgi:DNA-binding response OmpR family regulator